MQCMRNSTIPALCAGSLWALPTAVLATVSVPAAAVLAVLGLWSARWLRGPCRFAGLLALPALLAGLRAPTPPLPPLPAGPVVLHGEVRSVVRAPELGTVQLRLGRGPVPLRVSLDAECEVLPGDHIRVLAHVTPAAAPGLAPSIHAVAATATVQPGPWSLARACATARRAMERQLLAHLPAQEGAMLAALVLGRDTRPNGELVAAHRATGLSHLLAVSGAHAAMLAFLLGLCSWHGRRRIGASQRRTFVVLLLLVAYAAITGNEPPVLRAVAAYALAAAAGHLGRPCGIGPMLLAPAILTAFVQPEALLGPSFLLSYAAVVGLVLAGAPRGETFWQRWVLAPLRASGWATLLTAPLTLAFFGQLAPWTVVLTPLLAPLVGLLLLLGLALALLGLVLPSLAALLALPTGLLATLYQDLVQLANHLPATPVHAGFVPATWLLVLVAWVAACLVACRRDRRSVAAAAVLLSLPHFVPSTAPPAARFQLFAIGHGQACLAITERGHQIAIDCGSLQHPFLAAERLTAALQRRRLDLLVVTHGDQDHHNGVPALLDRVAIGTAILPQALAGSALAEQLRRCGVLVRVQAPGTTTTPLPGFTVSAPTLPEGATDNDQSLWASVAIGSARVLTTGDAQELGTAAALAAGIASPHDVLVLPHHGRANANAPALLLRVRPRVCLASAASSDGDTRLGPLVRRSGCELWTTGVHGTLTLAGTPPSVAGEIPGRPLPPASEAR